MATDSLPEGGPRRSKALAQLLGVYDRQFANNGSFRLMRGEDLRACIARNRVPDMPAAYLIYGIKGEESQLLYIGKSGTIRTDGLFKDQELARRLRMKQTKTKWRAEFYQEEMERQQLDALQFRWYVSFDRSVRILPFKAEADLLQAYFDDYGRLPPWNRTA